MLVPATERKRSIEEARPETSVGEKRPLRQIHAQNQKHEHLDRRCTIEWADWLGSD
jgi:hypothetical protein